MQTFQVRVAKFWGRLIYRNIFEFFQYLRQWKLTIFDAEMSLPLGHFQSP